MCCREPLIFQEESEQIDGFALTHKGSSPRQNARGIARGACVGRRDGPREPLGDNECETSGGHPCPGTALIGPVGSSAVQALLAVWNAGELSSNLLLSNAP